MDFRNPGFLTGHIHSILDFYDSAVVDSVNGGFVQNFTDDGRVFEPLTRHLVSSARLVFNYATAYRLFGDRRHLANVEHGLRYIEGVHRKHDVDGYHWRLADNRPVDSTNYCYGLAFVLLAYASAHAAGIAPARAGIHATADLMQRRFWQADTAVYADEAAADWSAVSAYRGQNANMHSCEALLAAYEATGEAAFLERAATLAHRFTVELASPGNGLIWEHYRQDLSIDWDYNRDDPANLYRPWGFQPGHQTEWAKLLLILHHHRPEAWMVERATALFDRAVDLAWDDEHGGLMFSLAPDGRVCDTDKYFWVQAESIAAAAWAAQATGEARYLSWYDRLWAYCWTHFIDHRHGAWYRVLTRDNRRTSDRKSIAGAKCDYHTLGACAEALRVFSDRP